MGVPISQSGPMMLRMAEPSWFDRKSTSEKPPSNIRNLWYSSHGPPAESGAGAAVTEGSRVGVAVGSRVLDGNKTVGEVIAKVGVAGRVEAVVGGTVVVVGFGETFTWQAQTKNINKRSGTIAVIAVCDLESLIFVSSTVIICVSLLHPLSVESQFRVSSQATSRNIERLLANMVLVLRLG